MNQSDNTLILPAATTARIAKILNALIKREEKKWLIEIRTAGRKSVLHNAKLYKTKKTKDKSTVNIQLLLRTNISREDAKKTACEWVGEGPSRAHVWLIPAIMDKTQHREIGKFFANICEPYVNEYLSEKTGRPIIAVTGEPHDSITGDDGILVRIQIKFRMSGWHMETTRRNSAKNVGISSTGHVAYRKEEFDMLAIFIPGPTFGITGSKIRCIPVSALVNPKKPDQLVTKISAPIRRLYDNDDKTDEVLAELF